ncbi:MAG: CHASE2 domain-containing protein [Leptolyngbyaceae cyanobacterium RU_5_1]|nr:CHASE2 domain-containing protein [Leptolyngbyaceae cyanobacterium RU_5_1]
MVATGLVLTARSLGVLQPLELWAFDRLLQLRPKEAPDDRLLIVTIDESEVQAQAAQGGRGSLSDQTLDRLLKELERHRPRVIGIDVYRDFAVSSRYPDLAAQLRRNQRLVAICKSSDAIADPTGIAPPPEVPESRVGFSDFLEDGDGVLRRQILKLDPDPASPCTTPYAFNARLAVQYLEPMGIRPESTSEGNLKLDQTVFQWLTERMGGYQGIDAGGNQIMLNYRSLSSPGAIAPQVSLTQVLQGKVRSQAIQDRIVLVGVIASSSGDVWITPYGTGTANEVPGVLIQAHMTSQILSAVLDRRSLIWVWNWAGEALWIGLWSLAGGLSMLWVQTNPSALARSRLFQGVIGVTAIAILTGLSGALLGQGGWIPLVPAGIALGIAGSITIYLNDQIRSKS